MSQNKTCCRICLDATDLLCLFSKSYTGSTAETYADMLKSIANLLVSVNDGLPDKICKKCSCDLKKCYSLKILAERTDKKLRSEMSNVGAKKLTFNSISDIKNKLDVLSVKKEKTKIVFDSIAEVKSKIQKLDVNLDRVGNVNVTNDDVTEEKITTEADDPIRIDSSDDDTDLNAGDTRNAADDDPDYEPDVETRPKKIHEKRKGRPPWSQKINSMNVGAVAVKNVQGLEIKKVPARTPNIKLNTSQATKKPIKPVPLIMNKSIKTPIVPEPQSPFPFRTKEKMVCPSCGVLTYTLDTHMQTHQERKYKCQFCPKTFLRQEQLDTHTKIHTGVRDYTCDECGKGFMNKRAMLKHTFSYHRDNPLTCSTCARKFATKITLRQHMEIHSGKKNFVCTICSQPFNRQHHLKTHMVVHTGERNYTCEICQFEFPYKKNLNVHVLREHNIDLKGRALNVFNEKVLQLEMDKISNQFTQPAS